MTNASYKYDVALSFLTQDIQIASALQKRLSQGLEVFFFPRNQEELAGTDGLESMRRPFYEESRLNVVVYRQKWGHTPWTGVEAAAIKDSCLANSFENIFLFAVEPADPMPVWLPQTHVRFNYGDFTIEDAVGAIKARVLEMGGHYHPMTAARRAAIFAADEEFRRQKAEMSSACGMTAIFEKVRELFNEIRSQCEQVNALGHLAIRSGFQIEQRSAIQTISLTDDRVGIIVTWEQSYSNTLEKSGLLVTEFAGGLILPDEYGKRMYFRDPQKLKATRYKPNLSPALEYGWSPERTNEFASSTSLAELILIQLMELVDRNNRGEIRRSNNY